jgi:hypothetical protein
MVLFLAWLGAAKAVEGDQSAMKGKWHRRARAITEAAIASLVK